MAAPDKADALRGLADEIVLCRRCPRLVEWREKMAIQKRAAFRHWDYWARPVPGFGDPDAELLVVGLAPAAHGANRTGRMFTGDRAGDWLYRALYRAGYANQPTSNQRDDGLRLMGAYVTAAVRCAPPGNRPTTQERDTCVPYLERELRLLKSVRIIVPLGGFAYDVVARLTGLWHRPPFGHGVEARLPEGRTVLCSYHPSQQNTFTRKLTEEMFEAIFRNAVRPGFSSPDSHALSVLTETLSSFAASSSVRPAFCRAQARTAGSTSYGIPSPSLSELAQADSTTTW